jgi:two-component sensor histidine kinase
MKTPTLKLAGIKQNLDSKHIKFWLVGMGVLISGTVLLYTQYLVNELREKEEKIVKLYANVIQHAVEDAESSNTEQNAQDFTFYLDGITPTINFPVILTDEKGEPLEPYHLNTLNILDSLKASQLSREQQQQLLKDAISQMSLEYQPLEVKLKDGTVLQKIYYTNSNLILNLKLFPYIEIFVIAGFIFLGYLGFNYIRGTEQSNVWVGLAKEAAHQLGTPLSSLLAWLEIVKMDAENPEQVREIVGQMEQDVERLSKITQRFSKIGSLPEMKEEDVSLLIQNVTIYFERRLPHLGKRVKIKRSIQNNVKLRINAELFEWVVENLVKNAAEAMESSGGIIDILLEQKQQKTVILVCDNGKGMTAKVRREAFKPGFSTKKRGWGLGLSLCKRIIEDYHGGKIMIKDTAPGKGTVFAIELPNLALQSELQKSASTEVKKPRPAVA